MGVQIPFKFRTEKMEQKKQNKKKAGNEMFVVSTLRPIKDAIVEQADKEGVSLSEYMRPFLFAIAKGRIARKEVVEVVK